MQNFPAYFQYITRIKGQNQHKVESVIKNLHFKLLCATETLSVFTFVGAGHPLYGPFVVVVLTDGKRKDAHLSADKSSLKKQVRGGKRQTGVWQAQLLKSGLCLRSYPLIRIVFLKDLLHLLLSAVSEEHDDLVAVGPRHVHLGD